MPRKIIVVDDNADVAESLALWLGDCGHDVRVTSTGAAALREAQVFAPEIMLIDVGLPDMSGHDVARTAAQDAASSRRDADRRDRVRAG